MLTLLRRNSELSDPAAQRALLEGLVEIPPFESRLPGELRAAGIDVLQLNVGRVCNQTCRHCHVDAGPDRRESLGREVALAALDVLERGGIATLDITGGAPEMNPHFRELVVGARRLGRRVIDRCNLTILVANGFEWLAEFLAEQQVEVVASLPCYLEENVDQQRGDDAFRRSIEALRRLNSLGYGRPDSPLSLQLVYNPLGPQLPPDQTRLEEDYRRELRARHGVEFTGLYTITNMPISRFLDDLVSSGRLAPYLQKLHDAFEPGNVEGLMCRRMLSVDWQGRLYDCDFHQMLELGLAAGPRTVFDLDDNALRELARRSIVTARHCYGCTAGAGSSCQGRLRV